MAESEAELKSLLMKVKEESEKVGLKLNFRILRSRHLPGFPVLHQLLELAQTHVHVNKIMLKILQVRLQQYMNQELSNVQARF